MNVHVSDVTERATARIEYAEFEKVKAGVLSTDLKAAGYEVELVETAPFYAAAMPVMRFGDDSATFGGRGEFTYPDGEGGQRPAAMQLLTIDRHVHKAMGNPENIEVWLRVATKEGE